jgi:hypothetical protein
MGEEPGKARRHTAQIAEMGKIEGAQSKSAGWGRPWITAGALLAILVGSTLRSARRSCRYAVVRWSDQGFRVARTIESLILS